MSKKILKEKYPNSHVKRQLFGDFTYRITHEGTDYHIKVLPVNRNTILSINSKYVWEIKYGIADTVNFRTMKSQLIDMKGFMKLENRIVVFKSAPFKILKYLNEADIIDISSTTEIFDCNVFRKMDQVKL